MNDERVGIATVVFTLFPVLKWRVARHRPAGMLMVIGLCRTPFFVEFFISFIGA